MAMNNKIDMNVFLHSLLVKEQMDNFTVSEAKDALLDHHAEFTDPVEARKFIYRQLTRNIEKGLIKRFDNPNEKIKKVTYSKTDLFFNSTIVPIKRVKKDKKELQRKPQKREVKTISYQTELQQELSTYEIDLNTLFEEAKEYKRLSSRYPELKAKLQLHQSQAKERSIKLLGKVHALQNLLGYETTGKPSC
jgi:hypothetical protein